MKVNKTGKGRIKLFQAKKGKEMKRSRKNVVEEKKNIRERTRARVLRWLKVKLAKLPLHFCLIKRRRWLEEEVVASSLSIAYTSHLTQNDIKCNTN